MPKSNIRTFSLDEIAIYFKKQILSKYSPSFVNIPHNRKLDIKKYSLLFRNQICMYSV